MELKDPDLIGIICSGMYMYNNGHIYYANNCIKIRQDLIGCDENLGLEESEVFDIYENILILDEGDKTSMLFPLFDFNYNRMFYVLENQKEAKLC
jgi:hypothetical protein